MLQIPCATPSTQNISTIETKTLKCESEVLIFDEIFTNRKINRIDHLKETPVFYSEHLLP